MRKIGAFISILLVLCACSQQEEITGTISSSNAGSTDHFYGVKRSAAEGVETRGLAQRRNLWYAGTTIKVRFLNGTEAYKQKVMTYAAEWEKEADINFQFVTEGKADVRIGFNWNDNRWITWSCTGTDCKIVTNQSDATLSFADWESKPEDEIKGDALRAFGQVLGLELEHRHLNFDPVWTSRIAEYWEMEIEDVPWEDLKEYVFDPLSASDVVMTREYDEQSIMIWPFHRRYADNTARYANYELSETDKQFINQLYPKEEEEEEGNLLIQFTHLYWRNMTGALEVFLDSHRSEIVIDWGDGIREIITPDQTATVHLYQNIGEYTTKIYGAADAIPNFRSTLYEFTDFVIAEGCLIESLEIINLNLTKGCNLHLDVTNAIELKSLRCDYYLLTQLDLSKNTHLESLSCVSSGLTQLDLSKNSRLESLDCTNNRLTQLDLTNCVLFLTSVDVSYNPLVTDSVALTNMIYSLHGKPGALGSLYTRGTTFSWHIPLCAERGWIVKD